MALLEACNCIVSIVRIFNDNGTVMAGSDAKRCIELMNQVYKCTEYIEGMQIPKKHQCMHLLRDIPWFGNPRLYSNRTDESLNKLLKSFCRLVSQGTFDSFLLLRMRDRFREDDRKYVSGRDDIL